MDRNDITRRRLLQTSGALIAGAIAGCTSSGDGGDSTPENTSTAAPTSTTRAPTSTEAKTTTEGTTADPATTQASSNDPVGPRDGDDLPKDDEPLDGYPPEFEHAPAPRNVDPSSFETVDRDGTEVKLVPADVAYYWYARGEARFADARSEVEFDVSHVFGAVASPAPDGRKHYDAPNSWPKDDRIICYCRCPHHLSSLRAADLIEKGYSEVYAIDEGFDAWLDRGYPVAGTDTDRTVKVRTITGHTAKADAGETVWAVHEPTKQQEASAINEDGSYELKLKFVNITPDSTIHIETPSYTLDAKLGALVNGAVSADGEVVQGTETTASSLLGRFR